MTTLFIKDAEDLSTLKALFPHVPDVVLVDHLQAFTSTDRLELISNLLLDYEQDSNDVISESNDISICNDELPTSPCVTPLIARERTLPSYTSSHDQTSFLPSYTSSHDQTSFLPSYSSSSDKTSFLPSYRSSNDLTSLLPSYSSSHDLTSLLPSYSSSHDLTSLFPTIIDSSSYNSPSVFSQFINSSIGSTTSVFPQLMNSSIGSSTSVFPQLINSSVGSSTSVFPQLINSSIGSSTCIPASLFPGIPTRSTVNSACIPPSVFPVIPTRSTVNSAWISPSVFPVYTTPSTISNTSTSTSVSLDVTRPTGFHSPDNKTRIFDVTTIDDDDELPSCNIFPTVSTSTKTSPMTTFSVYPTLRLKLTPTVSNICQSSLTPTITQSDVFPTNSYSVGMLSRITTSPNRTSFSPSKRKIPDSNVSDTSYAVNKTPYYSASPRRNVKSISLLTSPKKEVSTDIASMIGLQRNITLPERGLNKSNLLTSPSKSATSPENGVMSADKEEVFVTKIVKSPEKGVKTSSNDMNGRIVISPDTCNTIDSSSYSSPYSDVNRRNVSSSGNGINRNILSSSENNVKTEYTLPPQYKGGLKIAGYGFDYSKYDPYRKYGPRKKKETKENKTQSKPDELIQNIPIDSPNRTPTYWENKSNWLIELKTRFTTRSNVGLLDELKKFYSHESPLSVTIQHLDSLSDVYTEQEFQTNDDQWNHKWYWKENMVKGNTEVTDKPFEKWSQDKLEQSYQIHHDNKCEVKILLRRTKIMKSFQVNFFSLQYYQDGQMFYLIRKKTSKKEMIKPATEDEFRVEYPSYWNTNSSSQLLEVSKTSNEWKKVESQFLASLNRTAVTHQPNAKKQRQHKTFVNRLNSKVAITSIQRVQNKGLYRKYCFHKKEMIRKNGIVNVNEKQLFHGTSRNDPVVIWESEQGFDLRYCAQGAWGRGSYFADESIYSLNYSFQKPHDQTSQMFLANVLTGYSSQQNPNGNLTKPPVRARTSNGADILYDSVTGKSGSTQIYIVYQLHVAYPSYLITFKRS